MGAKRLRHPGGVSWLTMRTNEAGEWSLRVIPEELLIDTFHRGGEAHLHDPDDYDRRIDLGRLRPEHTEAVVRRHLLAFGELRLDDLVEELKAP